MKLARELTADPVVVVVVTVAVAIALAVATGVAVAAVVMVAVAVVVVADDATRIAIDAPVATTASRVGS
jgi:Na+/H+-translocating membrane pyrophosphatase